MMIRCRGNEQVPESLLRDLFRGDESRPGIVKRCYFALLTTLTTNFTSE